MWQCTSVRQSDKKTQNLIQLTSTYIEEVNQVFKENSNEEIKEASPSFKIWKLADH